MCSSMANLEFSVPYNNDPETLTEVFKLKLQKGNRIREVYLSGPQQYSGSGRITEEMNEAEFIGIMKRIHEEGLRVNLLMNTTCEGLEWYNPEVVKTKIDFLRRMYEEHGLEAVTLANPLYVAEVRRHFPDLEICASVLGEIDCLERAEIFARLGANVITPDVDINRNLPLLRKMKKAIKGEFKLMVNDGCLYKCPFRRFHFNYISHRSKEVAPIEGDAFFANCSQVTLWDYSQIFKSGWIRPEDLEGYTDITPFFKIVGRARPRSMVLRTVDAYMKQRWDGDLLDILSGSLNKLGLEYGAHLENKCLTDYGFFARITSCGYDCLDCDYCQDLAAKLMRFRVITRGKLEDLQLKEAADELERMGKLP